MNGPVPPMIVTAMLAVPLEQTVETLAVIDASVAGSLSIAVTAVLPVVVLQEPRLACA